MLWPNPGRGSILGRVSFKILHAADLHLDSPLRGLESDPDAPAALIRGATRQALGNLVDFALSEQVAAVLLAGDLYDGDWQDFRTGQHLVAALQRLTSAGIRVVAISGNHDAESVITRRLRWPEGAVLLPAKETATIAIPELNLRIHGRSFAQREVTENLLLSYPRPVEGAINIGLLHSSAEDAGGEHKRYAPCTVGQLRDFGYQYWALGHIHTRAELSRDPWIVFPGNLQGRHARETGPKGATLITCEGARILDVRHQDLDAVRWAALETDLTGARTEDEAMAAIRATLAAAITGAAPRLLAARLRLHGRTAAHAALLASPDSTREKIRNEALAAGGAGALWLEAIRIDTAPLTPRAAASPAESLLRDRLAQPPAEAVRADAAAWAGAILDKYPALRGELGAGQDAPDDALVEDARALLLALLDGAA